MYFLKTICNFLNVEWKENIHCKITENFWLSDKKWMFVFLLIDFDLMPDKAIYLLIKIVL